MCVCRCSPHTAFLQTVALSNVAGFAGGLSNLAFNMPKKNPVTPGPLIDYDLLLLVRWHTATTHPATARKHSNGAGCTSNQTPDTSATASSGMVQGKRMQCVTTQAAGQAVTPLLLPLPYLLAAAAACQVGAPIIMGSIGGAKAAYFIPGWITKTLMLLMLMPLTWRMVKKAKLLW